MKYIKLFEDYSTPIFFEPDDVFIDWLIDYANGRVIIDIGSGTHAMLSKRIYTKGYKKVMAVEPTMSLTDIKKIKNEIGIDFKIFHYDGEMLANMYQKTDMYEPLLIFARPCHNRFVENILKLKGNDVEALYITLPENLTLFNDLGIFKEKAKKINFKGTSKEKEVVLSII